MKLPDSLERLRDFLGPEIAIIIFAFLATPVGVALWFIFGNWLTRQG